MTELNGFIVRSECTFNFYAVHTLYLVLKLINTCVMFVFSQEQFFYIVFGINNFGLLNMMLLLIIYGITCT